MHSAILLHNLGEKSKAINTEDGYVYELIGGGKSVIYQEELSQAMKLFAAKNQLISVLDN